ncbi:MAG: EAL domain-containing response regulator [Thermoanaerobaculia bacterium]
MEKSYPDCIMIIDDDPSVTEGLALALQNRGRRIITCNDVESAELILDRVVPSLIVADVQFSGMFGYEGLDFIRYALDRSSSMRVVIMTGKPSSELKAEAMRRGAIAFLGKPFEVAALEPFLEGPGNDDGEIPVVRVPVLDEIVVSDDLVPVFQPIYRINDAHQVRVFAFEALTRLRTESPISAPDTLFEYASRKKRVVDLELSCMMQSLSHGRSLVERGCLFLNVHPKALSADGRLVRTLIQQAGECGIPLDKLVIEITEQSSFSDHAAAERAFGTLRDAGVRLALDDVGVAYSHFPMLDVIRPSYLKISQHFGCSFEEDPTKVKIVRNILSLARDLSAEVILEGVESAATVEAAIDLGIRLVQGYHYGRPALAAVVYDADGLPA